MSIADFGCGDAKIAQSVTNPVYSFDLVKTNEHVIVANSKKVCSLVESFSIIHLQLSSKVGFFEVVTPFCRAASYLRVKAPFALTYRQKTEYHRKEHNFG